MHDKILFKQKEWQVGQCHVNHRDYIIEGAAASQIVHAAMKALRKRYPHAGLLEVRATVECEVVNFAGLCDDEYKPLEGEEVTGWKDDKTPGESADVARTGEERDDG